MMNKQTIFDTAVKHLAAQKTRAISPTGICAYRDTKGRKCAVCCLIKDEDYNSEMECNNVATLISLKMLPDYLKDEAPLLFQLQGIHDTPSDLNLMHEQLRNLAHMQDLDGSVVDLLTEWNP
jgi:uncharacterized protein (DUF849 family)